MINLRLAIICDRTLDPFVVRLTEGIPQCNEDAIFFSSESGMLGYRTTKTEFWIQGVEPEEIAGDVLLIDPGRQIAHRLIRRSSKHNTFLITEQCDQLCIMCSQPPKAYHEDMFAHFLTAARLAPDGAHIGLSGGEPLLHKKALFSFIDEVFAIRDDITFHILSNGQNLSDDDLPWLHEHRDRLVWGIPIYSSKPEAHDEIVGKQGAFERLCHALAILGLAGAALELRTVVMVQNVLNLPKLADFITRHLPFAMTWAIMQLEPIGFGRMNWCECFFDSSLDFSAIGTAIDVMRARNQDVRLYNFPLCTVPPVYREIATKSISDWKQKYLPICATCNLRGGCSGFFKWYKEEYGFKRIGPQ